MFVNGRWYIHLYLVRPTFRWPVYVRALTRAYVSMLFLNDILLTYALVQFPHQVHIFSMPTEARRPVLSEVGAVGDLTKWKRKFV